MYRLWRGGIAAAAVMMAGVGQVRGPVRGPLQFEMRKSGFAPEGDLAVLILKRQSDP